MITVAQAFHWFNIEAFAKEANRVLKADGVLAVWAYKLLSVQDDIDEIINYFYSTILGEFWTTEREMVENGYRDIRLPFRELDAPVFQITAEWNLSQLIGYLCTWSAVKKYQKKLGVNPVEEISSELVRVWGQGENLRSVKWPLSLRLWQKHND